MKTFIQETGPTAALKLMAELNVLEVEAVDAFDIPTPSQWLSEIQTLVFEDFKRQLRKQIESLQVFPELKTTLTSSELHHHYVSKRFALLMLSCLQTLASFQRPWDLVLVELKKLEQAFFDWATKVATYLRDREEAFVFLVNNYDLVARICGPLAGADFAASLKFKFEAQIDRLVQVHLEKFLPELKARTLNHQICSQMAMKLKTAAMTLKELSFTLFSNVEVGQQYREHISQEAVKQYTHFIDIYDRNYGKTKLESESEQPPPDLQTAKGILTVNLLNE